MAKREIVKKKTAGTASRLFIARGPVEKRPPDPLASLKDWASRLDAFLRTDTAGGKLSSFIYRPHSADKALMELSAAHPEIVKQLLKSVKKTDRWSNKLGKDEAAKQNLIDAMHLLMDRINWALEIVKPAPPSDSYLDDLVNTKQIAKLVHLSPETMRTYRSDWPTPDVSHSGRSAAKWSYRRLLSTLKEQFPDTNFPDSWPIPTD